MLSIVFSKDRPLQLQGYVESLLHNADCKIVAIVKEINPDYRQVEGESGVELVEEHGLLQTFREVLASARDDYILLGVDDTVFTRPLIGLDDILVNSDIFSVSTRVDPPKGNTWRTHDYEKYSPHGYCFELAGVIYRRRDLLRFAFSDLDPFCGRVDTPNDIEVAGVNYFWQEPRIIYSSGVRSLTMHVNRVQDKHKNKFGSISAGSLAIKYRLGSRLDWKRLQGVALRNPNVEDGYFKLRTKKAVG